MQETKIKREWDLAVKRKINLYEERRKDLYKIANGEIQPMIFKIGKHIYNVGLMKEEQFELTIESYQDDIERAYKEFKEKMLESSDSIDMLDLAFKCLDSYKAILPDNSCFAGGLEDNIRLAVVDEYENHISEMELINVLDIFEQINFFDLADFHHWRSIHSAINNYLIDYIEPLSKKLKSNNSS